MGIASVLKGYKCGRVVTFKCGAKRDGIWRLDNDPCYMAVCVLYR